MLNEFLLWKLSECGGFRVWVFLGSEVFYV